MKASILRNFALYLVLAILLAASGTLFAPATHAGALNSDVIAMFPSSAGEFAYADLRAARQFPWFAQLKEQMLPPKFRQFEQFLSKAGMDPNTQVEELAWALVPTGVSSGPAGTSVPTAEQIVGVALGQFQTSTVQTYFKTQKTASIQSHGYTLYAFGGGTGPDDLFFLFIDSSTAAFGQRSLLEKLLDVRFGGQQNITSNPVIYPLINQANGKGIVWAVLNPSYTRLAMQQLLPELGQLNQVGPLLAKIQSMLITVQSSNGIAAAFQANYATPDDANQMAGLLQAGIMVGKYQATSQNNAALGQMLDSARVNPSGNALSVSVALTNDEMAALIKSNTFAVKM